MHHSLEPYCIPHAFIHFEVTTFFHEKKYIFVQKSKKCVVTDVPTKLHDHVSVTTMTILQIYRDRPYLVVCPVSGRLSSSCACPCPLHPKPPPSQCHLSPCSSTGCSLPSNKSHGLTVREYARRIFLYF